MNKRTGMNSEEAKKFLETRPSCKKLIEGLKADGLLHKMDVMIHEDCLNDNGLPVNIIAVARLAGYL